MFVPIVLMGDVPLIELPLLLGLLSRPEAFARGLAVLVGDGVTADAAWAISRNLQAHHCSSCEYVRTGIRYLNERVLHARGSTRCHRAAR